MSYIVEGRLCRCMVSSGGLILILVVNQLKGGGVVMLSPILVLVASRAMATMLVPLLTMSPDPLAHSRHIVNVLNLPFTVGSAGNMAIASWVQSELVLALAVALHHRLSLPFVFCRVQRIY